MDTNNFSLADLKQLDIVDYLAKLDHLPVKVSGHNYWYLSPLRFEKEASFKVDRKLNAWYDHGIGKGGNLVDFGILYYGCSVKEFLQKMLVNDFSFQQQTPVKSQEKAECENKIIITDTHPIKNMALAYYLQERKIPLDVARLYCREVTYQLNNKEYYALGFANDSGGFELRNKYFKGSSSPKDSTLIRIEGAEQLTVVEGFFSFLSYQSILKAQAQPDTDFLVLNSLSFVQKNIDRMQSYPVTKLMLDNDLAGDNATAKILVISPAIKDERKLYLGHKDLNDFLMHPQAPVQKISQGKKINQSWNRHR